MANATNATAVPTAVAAGSDGQVFLRSGNTLTFGKIATSGLTDASVTYAKIQNGTGLSVLGRSANSAGVNADIVGTANQILRVNAAGTAVGFGTIFDAGVDAAAAIAGTKLVQISGLKI